MQGNCSDAEVGRVLSMAAADAASLPLKPHQCVIVVQEAFLMINSGKFWLENVYLLVLQTHVLPGLAFVRTGVRYSNSISREDNYFVNASIYLSNVTMQGTERGWSKGVELSSRASSLLVQGMLYEPAPPCLLNVYAAATCCRHI